MTDLCLRFETRDKWLALDLDRDPNLLIDAIGTIRKPIQQWTGDGEQVVPAVPGWHVNVRCTDDRDLSALEPFAVVPEHPFRVWSGSDGGNL